MFLVKSLQDIHDPEMTVEVRHWLLYSRCCQRLIGLSCGVLVCYPCLHISAIECAHNWKLIEIHNRCGRKIISLKISFYSLNFSWKESFSWRLEDPLVLDEPAYLLLVTWPGLMGSGGGDKNCSWNISTSSCWRYLSESEIIELRSSETEIRFKIWRTADLTQIYWGLSDLGTS